jgi:hypothetical protein
MDAKRKLQEIAAHDLGGGPEDYDVGSQRVFRKGASGRGLTFAQAAARAIGLGGKYDGHELPKDINAMTTDSATALAGIGLMGVARDNYGHKGQTLAFVVGFMEIEVDVETGEYKILDYLTVADVGTVLHPRGLEGQLRGGAIMGIGHTRGQKWVYDQQYGVPLAKWFHYNKPPTILDIPIRMQWDAVSPSRSADTGRCERRRRGRGRGRGRGLALCAGRRGRRRPHAPHARHARRAARVARGREARRSRPDDARLEVICRTSRYLLVWLTSKIWVTPPECLKVRARRSSDSIRGSRHETLQPLRFVPQPFRILRSTVEDGRGLEGLEFAARGRLGGP